MSTLDATLGPDQYINLELFDDPQPAAVDQPAPAPDNSLNAFWDFSLSFDTAPTALDSQPFLFASTDTWPMLSTSYTLDMPINAYKDAPGDAGGSSGTIAPLDTLASHQASDPTTASYHADKGHPSPPPTSGPSRKRRVSDSAATDGDDETENIAPRNGTVNKRAKRQGKRVAALDVTNIAPRPSLDTSSAPPPAPTDTVAAGLTPIIIGTSNKYGCITTASFAFLPDGRAQCLYDGPSNRMQNGEHKPLRVNHKVEPHRFYKHWISHERAEAMDIATTTIDFDEARLVKNAADQAVVFDNWPKCTECKCECEEAGKTCTFIHHGLRFARKDKLRAHEREGMCNQPQAEKEE